MSNLTCEFLEPLISLKFQIEQISRVSDFFGIFFWIVMKNSSNNIGDFWKGTKNLKNLIIKTYYQRKSLYLKQRKHPMWNRAVIKKYYDLYCKL